MERRRETLIRSIALFPLIVLAAIIAGGNIVAFQSTSKLFAEKSVELSLGETAVVHRFIEVAQSKALESYLKGIADDLYFSLDAVNSMVEQGEISREYSMDFIRNSLRCRKIGYSGYAFIIDDLGDILRFHPSSDLEGTTLVENGPIRRQLKCSEGYFEYLWANPGENAKRRKAAYSLKFEPLGWTVVVSAYVKDFPHLVVLDDLRGFLSDLSDANIETYILDENGRFLIHPELEGVNIEDLPEWKGLARDLRKDFDVGNLVLPIGGHDNSVGDSRIVRYSRLRDFGWIVVSKINASPTREIIKKTLAVQLGLTIGLIALVGLVVFGFGRILSKPILDLHSTVVEALVPEGSLFGRNNIDGITRPLLQFKNQLEGDRKALAAMARFVSESPMPILRICRDWTCSFANAAAQQFVVSHLLDETKSIQASRRDDLIQCFRDSSVSAITVGERRFLANATGDWYEGEAYIAFLDITDSNKYETLRSLWDSVMSHSREGILIVDNEGFIQKVNSRFTGITGYEEDEAIGKNIRILLRLGVHGTRFYEGISAVLRLDSPWKDEAWWRRKNGEVFPIKFSVSPIAEFGTDKRRVIIVFHDVSLVRNQEQTIHRMQWSDRLTELPNRGTFYENLSDRLGALGKGKNDIAVVLVDIDDFSRINHTFGMRAGDHILKIVAGILKKNVRENDVAARIDGDEFGILLDVPPESDTVFDVTDRIRESLHEGVEFEGRKIRFTVSGGVVYSLRHGQTADDLIANANAALRRAKKEAVGTFLVFEGAKDSAESEAYEFEIALKESLANNELFLQYQPIVSGDDGYCTSFEALIRWKRSDGTIVPPDQFIPVAERTGFIIPLGKWIISECCDMIAEFNPENAPVVAANVSARQFADENFFGDLNAIVRSYDIPADCLALEITENIAAVDVDETIRLLNDIKAAGYSVSIDDFGTGYSSLKYIRDFSFEKLKVDKSFIDALGVDFEKQAIVEAIISMGHSLGKKVIAEGVETEEQARMLRDLDCDYMQGYLYAKPLDRHTAVEFWNQNAKRT